MSKPTGKIVADWNEFGHHFQIEELEEPILKGAGMRSHRLWDNGDPAFGGQWHYDLDGAQHEAQYRTKSSYIDRIVWLENRVRSLESRLFKNEH